MRESQSYLRLILLKTSVIETLETTALVFYYENTICTAQPGLFRQRCFFVTVAIRLSILLLPFLTRSGKLTVTSGELACP